MLIRGARWSHSKGKWSAPFTMADTPGFPETNPVLFLDRKQRLFFFWPLIVAHQWETALMKYRISTDYQQADGPPKWEFQDNIVLIPKNIAAKTKEFAGDRDRGATLAGRRRRPADRARRRRVLLAHGLVHAHASAASCRRAASWCRCTPTATRSASWRSATTAASPGPAASRSSARGCIQPSVVRKNDGTLVAYLRDNGPPPKRAHISTVNDDGVSWTDARDTDIPNPGTSLEVVRLRNGHWIMVYNDLERGRYSLVAAISDDEGATWKEAPTSTAARRRECTNQYHYPSVIQASDGAIHVTYSYFTPEGKSIKHVRFDESWVRAGDSAVGAGLKTGAPTTDESNVHALASNRS